MNELRELLIQVKGNQTSNAQDTGNSIIEDTSKIKEAIIEVATSIRLDTNTDFDLGDFGDLIK